VGVFPVEPLTFIDKQGIAQGLFPDLLREIVKDESWTVAFVPGSWSDGLERLQKGEIDLMLSVAYSSERAEIMDFNYESVVELWGQVFVNPEGKSKNIDDLDGRKVAVMRKDIAGSNFIMTTEKLGVRCEIIEFATHAEVFTAVKKGAADAGVSPQHIGLRHAKEYNLVGSSIIFSPFSVFFASKKGMQHELLSHIDAHISNWKKDSDSFYYNRLNYWIGGQNPGTKIPVWLIYASIIGVFVILLFVGFTVLLKRTVRVRTKELRESEAVRSKMIANIGDVIVIIDRNGINRYKSPNIEKWFGWKPEDVVGFNTWENVHPDDLDKGQTFIGALALTPNASGTTEVRYRCKDGNYKWIEITIVNLLHDTSINGFLGNYQDITERKQTEEALRKSEKLLSRAQEIAHTGSWTLDLTENRLTWSDEVYRIFGYEPREFAATYEAFLDAVHPDERVMVNEAYSRSVLEGSDGYEFEHRIVRRKSGEVRHVHERCVHERDDAGTVIRSTGMVQDITERKQSEEALTESEARFKSLHNASFGGIAIHDNSIILECNQGLAEISGYSTEELIGMNGLLLISEKTRGMVLQNIRDGYEKPYEAIGLRKNNDEYPVRLEARNIPYKGKNVRVVEFRDITEQKRQEEEKSQLENKLRQSQKMEAVGQLAGGVAHDFNNMLGVITGYSELILVQMDPAQQFHAELVEIKKAARRSADLTRQLLTFARKQTVAPKVLDLNQTIEGMLNLLRRLIGENISLSWMPGFGLWPIHMDPSQIDQILANLCVNARDAIAGVGKLTVETKNATFDKEYCSTHAGSLPGDYVRIAVSETGSGMDKETLAHIFEPFFTTKNVGEGTGLGLATVYGAVKQNNGFINAYSEPGQGTTFTIYIPRHVETNTETQVTASIEPVVYGDEIVMLVEDEPTLLQMSKTMLERLGYTVLAAGTPAEAIRLAGEYSGQIHLLATDVIMPEMNGRELSARLLKNRPEMKYFFMSGYTANIIANQGVLEKGVPFLQKPFSINELANKVREAMES
jgi:PAS domain S-box-containing protein